MIWAFVSSTNLAMDNKKERHKYRVTLLNYASRAVPKTLAAPPFAAICCTFSLPLALPSIRLYQRQ